MTTRRQRHATAAAHVISDVIGAIPALIVVGILIAFAAPTWAWLAIGVTVWGVCSHTIMRELRNDREVGKWLR